MERIDVNIEQAVYARIIPQEAKPEHPEIKAEQPLTVTVEGNIENNIEGNILEAIKMLGFKASEKNIQLAEALLQNSLPLNDENFRSLNRAFILTGDLKQAVFMVKNQIPVNAKSAEMMKSFVSNDFQVLKILEEIVKLIEEMPESPAKEKLTVLFSSEKPETSQPATPNPPDNQHTTPVQATAPGRQDNPPQNPIPQTTQQTPETPVRETAPNPPNNQYTTPVGATAPGRLDIQHATPAATQPPNIQHTPPVRATAPGRLDNPPQNPTPQPPDTPIPKTPLMQKTLEKFAIDPEKDDKNELNNRLNTLRQTISEARQTISNNDTNPRLGEQLDRLERSLDFMNDIKRMLYLQIPLWNGEDSRNMGLYVFRDREKKTGGKKGTQSALLSLDFAALGHLEAYVQRIGAGVNIRFKTEDDIKPILLSNISELSAKLKNKGFRLDAYSFALVSEPFVLTDNEPTGDSSEKKSGQLLNLDIKA